MGCRRKKKISLSGISDGRRDGGGGGDGGGSGGD